MALKPERLPISPTPLFPTLAFFLSHQPSSSSTLIKDLTPFLPQLYNSASLTESLDLSQATKAVTETPPPPTIYTLKKNNLWGTHAVVTNGEGEKVAEWKSPMWSLKMGTTSISFLGEEGQRHSDHQIEIRPVGFGRRPQSFVKDSVTYVWEFGEHHHEKKILYKVVAGLDEANPKTKIEIARFLSKAANVKDGVVVIDGRDIDGLVAVLTLCAVLETKDSFTM